MKNLSDLICDKNDGLNAVMTKIEANATGGIIVVSDKRVVGTITDGDIRRFLIANGVGVDATAKMLCNEGFEYANVRDSYESRISRFSKKIKFLPILNDDGSLADVEFFNVAYKSNEKNAVHARAPARITFGGGGSDKLDFFKTSRGLCLNAAIKKYAFCTLCEPDDGCVVQIVSSDYQHEWKYQKIEDFFDAMDPRLLIYKNVMSFMDYDWPIKIITHCDFPIGSGLGGSSALTVALLHAFNELGGFSISKLRLAQDAYKLERLAMGINGGWQDQYVAAVGGINALHFSEEKHDVHNLKLDDRILRELEASLYLCFSGLSHDSSQIHNGIDLSDNDRALKMQETVRLATEMLSSLTNADLSNFDRNMNENWALKKQYSDKISNVELDEQIMSFRESGATSVKILGAGGGGYFLARVPVQSQHTFSKFCSVNNILPERVTFDYEGVVSWI